jgi:hypothetical protein
MVKVRGVMMEDINFMASAPWLKGYYSKINFSFSPPIILRLLSGGYFNALDGIKVNPESMI